MLTVETDGVGDLLDDLGVVVCPNDLTTMDAAGAGVTVHVCGEAGLPAHDHLPALLTALLARASR